MNELLPHFAIITVITVLAYLLLHKYFPIEEKTPESKKQKNFWVIILTVTLFIFECFFVILLHSITTFHNVDRQIKDGLILTEGLNLKQKKCLPI